MLSESNLIWSSFPWAAHVSPFQSNRSIDIVSSIASDQSAFPSYQRHACALCIHSSPTIVSPPLSFKPTSSETPLTKCMHATTSLVTITDLVDSLDLDPELVGYLWQCPVIGLRPRTEHPRRGRRPPGLTLDPQLVLRGQPPEGHHGVLQVHRAAVLRTRRGGELVHGKGLLGNWKRGKGSTLRNEIHQFVAMIRSGK